MDNKDLDRLKNENHFHKLSVILNNVDLIVLGNHDRLAITNENLEGEDSVVRESILFTVAATIRQPDKRNVWNGSINSMGPSSIWDGTSR